MNLSIQGASSLLNLIREKIIGCSCFYCKSGRKKALKQSHKLIRRKYKQLLKINKEIEEMNTPIVYSIGYTD